MISEISSWFLQHKCSLLPKSTWFETESYAVYVRSKSNVSLHVGNPVAAISTISVTYPGNRVGTSLIDSITSTVAEIGYKGIAIEQVVNPKFAEYLARNGWSKFGDDEPPTYVKFFNNKGT